jgi:hypothetical protein
MADSIERQPIGKELQQVKDTMVDKLKGPVLLCLLAALTFAVYRPVLDLGFISYDDPLFVTKNAAVLNGVTLEGALWAMTATAAGNWFPLTWLSHMLDVSLYGVSAGGHHFTSLLIHIANVLLLFVVLRHVTGRWWRSFLAAALFAVHPLHVEPVAWIAQRRELLSSCFGLLALGAYVRYAKARTPGRYLTVAVLFAVAILLAFSVAARYQPSFWKNSLTLFTRYLEVTGPNPTALLSLGKACDDLGRTEKAVSLYRQALRQSPEAARVLYNLGWHRKTWETASKMRSYST